MFPPTCRLILLHMSWVFFSSLKYISNLLCKQYKSKLHVYFTTWTQQSETIISTCIKLKSNFYKAVSDTCAVEGPDVITWMLKLTLVCHSNSELKRKVSLKDYIRNLIRWCHCPFHLCPENKQGEFYRPRETQWFILLSSRDGFCQGAPSQTWPVRKLK